MAERCPKCSSVERIKAGLSNAKMQRFKCKGCGCHYTRSDKKGYPLILRRQAIQLYLSGLGFRAVGRILNVSNVTVLNWVHGLKEQLDDFKSLEVNKVKVLEINEVYKHIRSKNKLNSSVLMIRLPHVAQSQVRWALVETCQHQKVEIQKLYNALNKPDLP